MTPEDLDTYFDRRDAQFVEQLREITGSHPVTQRPARIKMLGTILGIVVVLSGIGWSATKLVLITRAEAHEMHHGISTDAADRGKQHEGQGHKLLRKEVSAQGEQLNSIEKMSVETHDNVIRLLERLRPRSGR